MKKVLVVIVLSLVVSLFVAGTYDRTITGSVASELCFDSDGGTDYYKRGTARKGNSGLTDFCKDNKNLIEGVCDRGRFNEVHYPCMIGCEEGVCQIIK